MLGCGEPSACPPAQWEPQRLPGTCLWAQSSGRQTSLKDRPPGNQKNTVPMATIASTHRTTLLTANVWLFHTYHPLCDNADTQHGLGALWFHSVLTSMTRVSPEPLRSGSAPREYSAPDTSASSRSPTPLTDRTLETGGSHDPHLRFATLLEWLTEPRESRLTSTGFSSRVQLRDGHMEDPPSPAGRTAGQREPRSAPGPKSWPGRLPVPRGGREPSAAL